MNSQKKLLAEIQRIEFEDERKLLEDIRSLLMELSNDAFEDLASTYENEDAMIYALMRHSVESMNQKSRLGKI